MAIDALYLRTLDQRARRALGGRTVNDAAKRYRAIVGPKLSKEYEQLAARALEALDNMDQLLGDEAGLADAQRHLEALEMLVISLRPSVLTHEGVAGSLPEATEESFPEWAHFTDITKDLLFSVCRIDRVGSTELIRAPEGIGTGFLVADGLVVTNRHVVEELTFNTGVLAPGVAELSFDSEFEAPDRFPSVPVTRVRATSPVLDIALLEIEMPAAMTSLPALKINTDALTVGDRVAAVGYTQKDAIRNTLFTPVVFEGKYGVKRVAPGEVIGMDASVFYHDCSTLGGNSGSPILSMQTGEVVGLHYAGTFLRRNEAVKATEIENFIAAH